MTGVRTALLLVLLVASQGGAEAQPAGASQGLEGERQRVLALIDEGQFDEAEEGARALLEKMRAAGALESRDGLLSLQALVRVLVLSGNSGADESRQLAEQALSLGEKVLAADDPLLAQSCADLGNVRVAAEQFDDAEQLYERALSLREKAFGSDSLEASNSLADLARLHLALHDGDRAKPLLERELAIKEKLLGPDHKRIAPILNNLGLVAIIDGDYEEGRRLFERALPIVEKTYGPEHRYLTYPLDNLANIEEAVGNYPAALRLHERSFAILEKSFPPDHPEIGMSLYAIASIHYQLGDLERALELDQRALAISEASSGPESVHTALVLSSLGRTRLALSDHAGALRDLERSLQIVDKTFGSDSTDAASRLLSIAEVREAMGEDAVAEPLYRQALEIYRKVDHPYTSDALMSIGLIRLRSGDLAPAADLLQQALRIRQSVYGPEHPLAAECEEGLAHVRWREGKLTEALDLALTAQASFRKYFQQSAFNLAEREALSYEKAFHSTRGLVLSLVAAAPAGSLPPGTARRVWDEIVRSRAVVLDEAARRHRAAIANEGAEAEALWKALVSARESLASLTVQGPDPEDPGAFREELDRATTARDRAERALAEKSATYRQRQREREITLRDIEARLPAGSSLVAYMRYDRIRPGVDVSQNPVNPQGQYMAGVVQAGKEPRFIPLGAAGELDDRVSRWRAEIAAGATIVGGLGGAAEGRYREAGARLREAMWDPVVPALRGARMVFIVPDGALNLVNPAALPDGEKGYLVEREPLIHLLSAERDLVAQVTAARPGKTELILGGPDFDGGVPRSGSVASGTAAVFRSAPATCRAFRDVRFHPLPASVGEANGIATLLGGASKREANAPDTTQPVAVMTGAAATESAFKQRSPQAKLLHLATHAFFDDGACEKSGDNPLLLSGLALAGANRRADVGASDEDGILTAEEIASLDLTGVEWAVLSACETGIGKIHPGEGVLGLRRAFQVAGARTVIMSLWKVEDASTRTWMEALYEGRLKQLSTVEAVRNASLEVLRDRREKGQTTHPYYWGAFLAAGDWR